MCRFHHDRLWRCRNKQLMKRLCGGVLYIATCSMPGRLVAAAKGRRSPRAMDVPSQRSWLARALDVNIRFLEAQLGGPTGEGGLHGTPQRRQAESEAPRSDEHQPGSQRGPGESHREPAATPAYAAGQLPNVQGGPSQGRDPGQLPAASPMSPLAHSVAPGNVAGLRATLPAHREEAGQEPRTTLRELQRRSLGLAALDDIKVQRSSQDLREQAMILSHPALHDGEYCRSVLRELADTEELVDRATVLSSCGEVNVTVELSAACAPPVAPKGPARATPGAPRGQGPRRSRSPLGRQPTQRYTGHFLDHSDADGDRCVPAGLYARGSVSPGVLTELRNSTLSASLR